MHPGVNEHLPTRGERLPGLDGLRAVAVFLVIVSHLAGTRGFPLSEDQGNVLALGQLGVHVFFVISGYLITTLLLRETERHQQIDLRRFYFRRTLRIFPPYYVFLIACTGLSIASGLISMRDLALAATYTSNYATGLAWQVGHTWSLSVEEQFYLLWPAVLAWTGKRRASLVALSAVALVPAIRYVEWRLGLFDSFHFYSFGIGHRFETVADALAMGCLLACWSDALCRTRIYSTLMKSRFFVIVPVAVVAISSLHGSTRAYYLLGLSALNLGCMLCIHWCVIHTTGRIATLINGRFLGTVGRASYSIYLWQQLFLDRNSSASWASFPLNLVLVIACGFVSWRFIERESLAIRVALERRWFPVPVDTPNHSEQSVLASAAVSASANPW